MTIQPQWFFCKNIRFELLPFMIVLYNFLTAQEKKMSKTKRFILMSLILIAGGYARASDNAFKDGAFAGDDGKVPAGWVFNYAKPGEGSGLTSKLNFPEYPVVMRIVGPQEKSIAFQSLRISFPDKQGTIRFSVWVKSNTGSGKMVLFLLGDEYKWNTNKEFPVTESWQEFSVEAAIPANIILKPQYWVRIDVPAGTDLLIGKTAVTFTPAQPADTITTN